MTPRDRDGAFTHTHGVMHLFPTGVKNVQTGIQMYAAGFVSRLTEGFEIPLNAYQARGESYIQGRVLNGLKREGEHATPTWTRRQFLTIHAGLPEFLQG